MYLLDGFGRQAGSVRTRARGNTAGWKEYAPFQVAALKRFRSRGFDILGLDWDDDVQIVKDYLNKTGMTWTQARKDSILTLTQDTYRIQEYPSSILLGPDGKVLVLDQTQLQGESLFDTLERILPKK